MSHTIPVALQTHLNQDATTTCRLLRIAPKRGAAFGYSSTNRAVDYNDGAGLITYQVQSGFDVSTVVGSADTSVDNAEARVLALAGGPVTEAMINAGELDGAEFSLYEVNYLGLVTGRHKVVMHGYVGRARSLRGAAFTLELRSLIDLLRQEPWEKYQRRCRVRQFGSQPGDERFPCMFALAPELVTGVAVTSVGTEANRTFTASSLAQAAAYFAPGMLTWTTGPNAGLSFEIETFATGGVITLAFPMPYLPVAGHQFTIRRECSREWSGHNSCQTFANRANFRGEPKMRPADAAATQIPGANASPGSGGATFVPEVSEA
jgi:uncharacterized phage protein (TIGR02218 family)